MLKGNKIANLTVAFAVILIAGVASASGGPSLNIRPGEWEVIINAKNQGVGTSSALAKDMARMPPAQRAKMQAMMAKIANRQVSHPFKSCITPQELKNSTVFFGDNDEGCKSSVVSKSGTRWEQTKVCGGDEPRTEHNSYQITDPMHVSGDGVATRGQGGKTTIHMTGHWIGPTCHKGNE